MDYGLWIWIWIMDYGLWIRINRGSLAISSLVAVAVGVPTRPAVSRRFRAHDRSTRQDTTSQHRRVATDAAACDARGDARWHRASAVLDRLLQTLVPASSDR